MPAPRKRFRTLPSTLALLASLTVLGSASAREIAQPDRVFDKSGQNPVVEPMPDEGAMPPAAPAAADCNLPRDYGCNPYSCNNSYCDGCCCDDGLLFGFIRPSDHCFDGFVSPMSNPVYFEDPRTLTEARMIFLHHRVPTAAGGGDVQLYALQVRAALTDRLSIVAAKDGYAVSSNPLIDDGWADVQAGLKYNLYRDPCCQRLLSVGFGYEAPAGSTRTLQGRGDGQLHFYLTGGTEFAPDWHWVSNTGFRHSIDQDVNSSMFYWSNHVDRRICGGLYGLVEANWYRWVSSGTGGVPGVEGGDLFSLGSPGVAGNDIVTLAFGSKYKPTDLMEIGVAYEIPVSNREDVIDGRLTVDWIIRY